MTRPFRFAMCCSRRRPTCWACHAEPLVRNCPWQIYVVPEEANQFTNFGEWSRRRAKRASKLPIFIAGGVAVLAVALVIGILVSLGKKPEPTTHAAPVVEAKVGPISTERIGAVDTKWVNFPSAPQARSVPAIASGIDVAPPKSKVVRTYSVRGNASLGAWIQPDGLHAALVGRMQIEILDLATGTARAAKTSG